MVRFLNSLGCCVDFLLPVLDFCVRVQAAVLVLGTLMGAVDLESAPEHCLVQLKRASRTETDPGKERTGSQRLTFFFFFLLFFLNRICILYYILLSFIIDNVIYVFLEA